MWTLHKNVNFLKLRNCLFGWEDKNEGEVSGEVDEGDETNPGHQGPGERLPGVQHLLNRGGGRLSN